MKVNPGGFAPAPDTGGGDDIQDKAEKFSNAATDAAENFEQAAKDAAAQAPKDAKEVANDPRFNSAYKTKQKVRKKMEDAEESGQPTEIKIDFDRYADFDENGQDPQTIESGALEHAMCFEIGATGCNTGFYESTSIRNAARHHYMQGAPEHLQGECGAH